MDEDDVEKEMAYLTKNFQKFMKMKNNVKFLARGNLHPSRITRNISRRMMLKNHHHLKESFAMNATSMDNSCDGDSNYYAFFVNYLGGHKGRTIRIE